ncbi:MAG: D-sedoheptulose 7-phosphate isomerase [Ignavibacteria bacterium]|nr:D-sedoheptulose 7-phosphate isomerase [Ignavibacteria bacterium]
MFDRIKFFDESLVESAETKQAIMTHCREDVFKAIDIMKSAISSGGKILFCGNGGSAADSQHLATEFIIRLSHDIKRPAIASIALTTDTSLLTAGANDIGYDNVFARQVEGLGREGDVLVGISTSGNSTSIIKAFEMAKSKGVKTIAFLGGSGGKIKGMADCEIIIPSSNTQRIQEGHITVGHIVCESVERELFL